MTTEQINEFERSLLEFVKRASKEYASPDEVEILPAVARVLVEVNRDVQKGRYRARALRAMKTAASEMTAVSFRKDENKNEPYT